jgi:hypothetical protein
MYANSYANLELNEMSTPLGNVLQNAVGIAYGLYIHIDDNYLPF